MEDVHPEVNAGVQAASFCFGLWIPCVSGVATCFQALHCLMFTDDRIRLLAGSNLCEVMDA